MLHELRIENLLLIERAEIALGPGLNAITGETGAGKTILTRALDLLLGGKARPDLLRPGSEEAYVEGVFGIPPGLFEDPDLAALADRASPDAQEIVLARRVTAQRSSALIGGRAASAAELHALGRRLVVFFGQHEHRKLTLATAQMGILDGSGGPGLVELREAHRRAFRTLRALEAELAEIREREGNRERDLDLLRFELTEIEAVAPDSAEREELEAERRTLQHAERLRLAAGRAAESLAGDDEGVAANVLAGAAAALAEVEGVDAELDSLATRVGEAVIELDDIAGALRARLGDIQADPARLEEIEQRLDAISRLERKHGGSIETVLGHAEHCRRRIAELEGAAERGAELEERISTASREQRELAKKLSAARRTAAKRLEKAAGGELAQLAMEGASLEARLVERDGGPGPDGAEQVELLVAPNPGLPPAALRDAASGGELSRVMLALSTSSGEADAPTIVFDEIDAGIGGHTARAVGDRLRALGDRRQVLCITHLPQVAALAARNYRIEKAATGGVTTASVERIEGEELVSELCRMLGADAADEAAARHARELLAA